MQGEKPEDNGLKALGTGLARHWPSGGGGGQGENPCPYDAFDQAGGHGLGHCLSGQRVDQVGDGRHDDGLARGQHLGGHDEKFPAAGGRALDRNRARS